MVEMREFWRRIRSDLMFSKRAVDQSSLHSKQMGTVSIREVGGWVSWVSERSRMVGLRQMKHFGMLGLFHVRSCWRRRAGGIVEVLLR